MNKELLIELDKVLVECRDDGSICMTKDTNGLTRKAINEAEARGWLYKYNSYTYKLASSGIEVLDFGTAEEYLLDKKSRKESISTPISTTVIMAKNVVYGDTFGDIDQSTKSHTTKPKTALTKSKISKLEWIGIVLGAIASVVTIYEILF